MTKAFLWLKDNSILFILLFIAAGLRLYHVEFQSLWLDEIHTMNECDPSLTLKEFYASLCIAEPHPPLYFYMARLSFYFFGHTPLVARMLVALIGIAGVWSIYLLGKEIHAKKTGLIAALLLAVNYFHIYYSQDARPYPLLFLATVVSFYFLVRFIKNPSARSAVLYGIFAGVMLYSHLFSLFALFAQCTIVLYFVLWPYNTQVSGKKLFTFSLISAAIAVVMYLPCLEILFISASRTSIWIAKPEPDAYVDLLKEFFGNFDVQLVFVCIGIILFIIGSIKEKRRGDQPAVLKFSGIVLFLWIFITLLLPWIRSYMVLPLIVSRYFINVLPAVILVVAIGFMQVKNSMVRYALVALLSLLSLYNIFIRRDYYTTVTKTQFREATQFIIKNNKNNTPVVSSLSWYLPYFLKNGSQNYTIVDKSLEDHVNAMIADPFKIQPFWYLDGHNRPYSPSDKAAKFLNDNFIVASRYEGKDIWTKYYRPIKETVIDISGIGRIQKNNVDQITYGLDQFEYSGNILKAKGWAFLPDANSAKSQILLCLVKDNQAKTIATVMNTRHDVRSYLKLKYDGSSNYGFQCEYDTTNLEPGQYQLAIYIVNKENNNIGFTVTDKAIAK